MASAAAGRDGTRYLDSRDGVHANLRNQPRQRRLVGRGRDLDYAADHGYGVYSRPTFYGASPSSARKHAAPNDWIGPGSRKVLRPFLGAVRAIWLLRDRL